MGICYSLLALLSPFHFATRLYALVDMCTSMEEVVIISIVINLLLPQRHICAVCRMSH